MASEVNDSREGNKVPNTDGKGGIEFKESPLRNPKGLVNRAHEIYRTGGVSLLASSGKRYTTKQLFGRDPYYKRRTDNKERWEMMEPFVDEANFLIDIGCAEGYFTEQAAKTGAFSIGIDIDATRIQSARKRTKNITNIGFMNWDLSPNSISHFPPCDVVLFLTVHHHWIRQFGSKEADGMFQIVMDRADTVVYEPPGNRTMDSSEEVLSSSESQSYYENEIETRYGDEVEVLESDRFEYNSKGDRTDPLFILNTKDFSIVEK